MGPRELWRGPQLLTNPVYAGAFVFGRTRQEKHVGANGQLHVKTIEVPMEEWSVCMPDHHPGYVSWKSISPTASACGRT